MRGGKVRIWFCFFFLVWFFVLMKVKKFKRRTRRVSGNNSLVYAAVYRTSEAISSFTTYGVYASYLQLNFIERMHVMGSISSPLHSPHSKRSLVASTRPLSHSLLTFKTSFGVVFTARRNAFYTQYMGCKITQTVWSRRYRSANYPLGPECNCVPLLRCLLKSRTPA
jgi:hypothetical protein